MTSENFNPGTALKTIKTIYFALIIGLLSFFAVTLMTLDGNTIFELKLQDPIFLAALIITCVAIPSGYYYSKTLFKLNSTASLSEKFPVYQTRLILRMAACEGSGLLAIVGLLISGNMSFLIFFLIAFFTMILYYPSPDKIGLELGLTQSEIDSFSNS